MTRAAISMLLIAALSARAEVDAGAELPPAVWARSAKLELPDAGWVDSQCFDQGDGGTSCAGGWLPDPRLLDEEQNHARLRAENERLMQAPAMFSTWNFLFLVAVGVAFLVLGGWVGWQVRGLWPR